MKKYCLVTQRLSKVLPDVEGVLDEVTGRVRFTLVLPYGHSYQVTTEKGLVTVPKTAVEADIVAGELTYEGEPGVSLFAGGSNSNPDEVYWRVEYIGLKVRDRSTHLEGFSFLAVPDGEVDLSFVTPITGATPVGITKGLDGDDGQDGLTPRIVDGSWWIGDQDTGVPATGEKGDTGEAPPRTPRILIYSGTGTPDLATFSDAQIGDYIVRKADGQEWKVEA